MWHWFSGHVSFTLPGNFCMAAVSTKQPVMGNCTGRADNTQENINQEDWMIQEYCIPDNMSKLFHPKCWKWPRAFPCKYLKLLSNLPKASSSNVSSALPAITKNPSQPQLPPWMLQPQLPLRLPQSLSPAVAATCCRATSSTAARCTLSPTRSWSPSGTLARDLPRGAGLASRPPSSRQPWRTLRSSHIAGKKRKI